MTAGPLSRDISKLIAAIEREWREELGGAEAAQTETVLRKVHRLLTILNQDHLDREFDRLQTQIGPDWLESHPWAMPYVLRIDAALTTMSHNATN